MFFHSKTASLCLPFLVSLLFIVGIPYFQIEWIYKRIWVPNKIPINQEKCTCSCFDTIFRGSFENQPVGYKHVYWNATRETLLIYILYVVNIILWFKAIECVCRLLQRHYARGGRQQPLRFEFLLLLLVNIYPNYYSWWSFFIYINEHMWSMALHHLPFYCSEFIVTAICIKLLDARDKRNTSLDAMKTVSLLSSEDASLVAWIITISLTHVLVGGLDQFIADLVLRENYHTSQYFRDVFLMLPDLLHIAIPLWVLCRQRVQDHWWQHIRGRYLLIRSFLVVFSVSFIMYLV